MSDKKPKLSSKQAEREAKNKRDYERLAKKLKLALEHHSPGVWDWIEDTIDDVKDWGTDVVDSVNDGFDKYVWDTDQDEGIVEGWVRDTFDIPDKESENFFEEAWDKVWDYGEDLVDKGKEQLDNIPDKVKDVIDDAIDDVKDTYNQTTNTINKTYTTAAGAVADVFNNIDIHVPPADFSFLEPLLDLPGALVSLNTIIQNLFTFDIQDYYETSAKLKQINPSA